MEHGPLWLQEGEYQCGQASHEELRNDDEDVVYALAAYAYMRGGKRRRSELLDGGQFWVKERTRMIPAFAPRLPPPGLPVPF